MRIAQIAPLWETVPPCTYGGIELVVSLLTDELVRRGHDVTLFASGDSVTLAHLEAVHPKALRLDPAIQEPEIYESLHLSALYRRASEFDLIHSHVGCSALPFAELVKTPTLHTLHGIFTPDNEKMYRFARQQPYVSISNAQRKPELELNCIATVYNGVAVEQFDFYPQPAEPEYLAFLGRISPEKGVHLAIEIAKQTGSCLKIAGKIDRVDRAYYEEQIKPQIDGEQIQFLGEANHAQKNVLLGNAKATLFPITWHEPFGLVMIESMVAGTPVIAMNLGSASEIIAHGKTGFLCSDLADCMNALKQVSQLDRSACRSHVVNHFSVNRMVNGYEAAYQQILAKNFTRNGYRLKSLAVN
jgi:glycosyltransferase involved in cell wall biosynthesis